MGRIGRGWQLTKTSWRVLRSDRSLAAFPVLGLISTKTPVLESIDDLKRRTQEAARYIDPDRLAIGPQCGFASTVAGNPVTEDDQRAKLRLIVEAAQDIWGQI